MDLWLDALRTGWHAVTAHRLRSLLTATTVALGAAAIACLISLSSSVFSTILSGVDAVGGHRMIFVEPRKPKLAKSRPTDVRLTLEDAAALRERVPGLERLAYLTSQRNVVLQGNGRSADVDVAIGSSYRTFLHHEVAWGRDLPPDGDRHASTNHRRGGFPNPPASIPPAPIPRHRELLLSEPIAKKLFDAPQRAVGKEVLLWGHRYRVVGVTEDLGLIGFNMGGADKERVIYLPASTAVQQEGLELDGYIVMLSNGTVSHDLQIRIANSILLHRHRGVDDFEFFDLMELLSTFEKVFVFLKIVLAVIGGVGLLVAGVGIMNVLLASVRQRVGELGIRRALGATEVDIKRQLLVESTLIAVGGGLVGTVAGVGMTALAGVVFSQSLPGWVTDLSPMAAACALVASASAGLLFGTVPARKAARLSIIGCLRGQVS